MGCTIREGNLMNGEEVKEIQPQARANRLYWHSDLGVNQIAEELGISKGALYGMVEPLSTGAPCPKGPGELVYTNRTARDRGFVTCPECGFEEEEARLREEGLFPLEVARAGTEDGSTPLGGADDRRLIWGVGLLGAAAGLLLVGWLRRR